MMGALTNRLVIVSLLSILSLLGIKASTNQEGAAGQGSNATVTSPFGSLSLGSLPNTEDLGMSIYPGARPKPDSKDDHNDSNANFNISSNLFGLKLMVQKYESDDPPEKILAFYEKQLATYGKVVRCDSNSEAQHSGNQPESCDPGGDYKTSLKVGTERNQHLVAVKPLGKGSSFVLVRVFVQQKGDPS